MSRYSSYLEETDILNLHEEWLILQNRFIEDLNLVSSLWALRSNDDIVDSSLDYNAEELSVRKVYEGGLDFRIRDGIYSWAYNTITLGQATRMYATNTETICLLAQKPLDLGFEDRRECLHFFHHAVKGYKIGLLENFNSRIAEIGVTPTGWELLRYQNHRFEEIQLEDTTTSIRVHPEKLNPQQTDERSKWELTYTISRGKEIMVMTVPNTGPNAHWEQAKLNGAEITHENFIEALKFLTDYAQFITNYRQYNKKSD